MSSLRLCGRNQALCVQYRLQPECRPLPGTETLLKVERCHQARGDDVLFQVRQHIGRKMLRDCLPIRLRRRLPVGVASQVRHRRQNVERIAARGSQGRIGRRRPVQIEAEILRQHLAFEDVAQQLAVTRTKDDCVVGDIFVAPVGAEIPQEQTHRVSRPLQPPISPAAARAGRQKLAIRPRGVGVRHNDVSPNCLARFQPHAGGASPAHRDVLDLRAVTDRAALTLDQTDQAADNFAGTAHGEMYAPAPLEERYQRVDAAGGERVAADQQGMKAEHNTQPRVLYVSADQRIHAAIAAKPEQVRNDPRHVCPGAERHMAELFETDAAGCFAQAHEALVAIEVVWREAGNLGTHGNRIAGAVETRPITEADTIKRRDRPQRHVVGHGVARTGARAPPAGTARSGSWVRCRR